MSASNRRGMSPWVATVSGDHMQDPLEALIAGGVPIRTLLGHQLCSLDWLAARLDHKFRLCYYGEIGDVVVESVSAVRLLTRGRELGWHPLDEEPFELGWPDLFKEPLYHYRHGVHWYATAISETDRMLPLAFPKFVLEKDRLATEAAARRAESRLRRQQKAKDKASAAERRDADLRNLARISARMQREAAQVGRPISAATARRRARGWIRQWERDVAAVMRRFTDSQESNHGQ